MIHVIYAHERFRWGIEHESLVMGHILKNVLQHPSVDTVTIAEFGEDVYDLAGIEHGAPHKLNRHQIPYNEKWRAGLIRNVAFGVAGLSRNDKCFFADTDVLITDDALRWIDEELEQGMLLQFPRTDLSIEATQQVLDGKRSIAGIREDMGNGKLRELNGTLFQSECFNRGEQAVVADDVYLLNGWDCVMWGWGGYDTDFLERARRNGLEIEFFPGQGTWHFFHPRHGATDEQNNNRNLAYSAEKIRRARRGA